MRGTIFLAGFPLLCVHVFAAAGNPQGGLNSSLPVVDLGYELHQAAFYNQTGNFYNFSNIPYAAPPLGELRFAAPQPPVVNRSGVNTGSVGRICPQAGPVPWLDIDIQFVPEYLEGLPINITTSVLGGSGGNSSIQLDPRTSEDCLLMDIVVPKPVLDNAGSNGEKAAVLVWIYGGGYVGGDKSGINGGSPAGLIQRSNGSIIYIALNYRLGGFGWLSGPTFQQSGSANAGLLDQRFALEWVQKYIHLFGGDPNRVTVMGESAGGGSLMHQITAYGGLKGPVPFQQAILQSPGFVPIVSNLQQETVFQTFLDLAGATSVEELRQLSTAQLIQANILLIANSTYGQYTYGPVVDGSFTPALPGQLLAQGQFDKSLKIMVGHNADEGLFFSSPFVTNQSAYDAAIQTTFPDISPSVLNYIDTVLYPPDFSGVYGYTDQFSRYVLTVSEYFFTCNTFYLDLAYNNQTYAYQFSVTPALHGEDLGYTYYNDGGLEPQILATFTFGLLSIRVALTLQDWIVTFVRDGVPSSPDVQGVPKFTLYGPNAQIENLNISSISVIRDPVADARCKWWQEALYY